MKKILVVDDSALMRRVLCDIINSDDRFTVVDKATNGVEAFELLTRKSYDAVVLDVNMPRMNGLELLQELRKYRIPAKVMMASTFTKDGVQVTMDALERGALDFIHMPDYVADCRQDTFRKELLRTLNVVSESAEPKFDVKRSRMNFVETVSNIVHSTKHTKTPKNLKRIVAIASSTGGPKALHVVIPQLPANLNAPVVIVQHMPKGFTATFAERLNSISQIKVKEAEDGEVLEAGQVYIAMGGQHLNIKQQSPGKQVIKYSDEPYREGVKPCANFMYESLENSDFDEIICVVMTGMGADSTVGIGSLKVEKKVHVIAQNESTSVVYGMPKSVINAGLSDKVVPLDQIAQEIILNVGIK